MGRLMAWRNEMLLRHGRKEMPVRLGQKEMKDKLKVSSAQFEPKDGDKAYNLQTMEALIARAAKEGSDAISFHELCTTGYTHLKNLDRKTLMELAEEIPDGLTTHELVSLADRYDIVIMAGVLEKEGDHLYNSYVAVDRTGLLARFRKIHPFISSYLSSGEEYVVFDLKGWKCGILICYDNNVIENVRATTLLGAEVIFAPHVTGCTPSSMPGRGYVADELWQKREEDPVPLRMEFDGPKHRGWLMRWLPARSFDNGVYYVFSNPIGYDGEHLKGGNAMILDPYGELLAESRSFDSDIATAVLTRDKLTLAGGYRYRNARRPSLYAEILGQEHQAETKPYWLKEERK